MKAALVIFNTACRARHASMPTPAVAAAMATCVDANALYTRSQSCADAVQRTVLLRDALQKRGQEAVMWREAVHPPCEGRAMRAELAAGVYCCCMEAYVQAFDFYLRVYTNQRCPGDESVGVALINLTTFVERAGRVGRPDRAWRRPPSMDDLAEMRRVLVEDEAASAAA